MYLTYVPGVFENWNHPRNIIHLTSKDLLNWKVRINIETCNDKVIDAWCFNFPITPGAYGTIMRWMESRSGMRTVRICTTGLTKGKQLQQEEKDQKFLNGKIITGWWLMYGKEWRSISPMILLNWTRQSSRILEVGGTGKDDGAIGGHCDVVLNNDRAFVFYFTHPGRTALNPAQGSSVEARRSVIQVAELEYKDGEISCNRNKPSFINLKH